MAKKGQGLAKKVRGWQKKSGVGKKSQGLAKKVRGWQKKSGVGKKSQGLAKKVRGWQKKSGVLNLFVRVSWYMGVERGTGGEGTYKKRSLSFFCEGVSPVRVKWLWFSLRLPSSIY